MSDGLFADAGASYPPAHHVLRSLPAEFETVDAETSLVRLRVDPGDPGGAVADLLVAVDVLCGLLVGRLVAPDWMATSHLSLHLLATPRTPLVTATTQVRRVGRTTVVVGVRAVDDGSDAAPAAEGLVMFSRLPRRAENLTLPPVVPGERTALGGLDAVPGAALAGLGPPVRDPDGLVRTEVSAWSRNSFGAMNGGVVAALVAQVAAVAGAERLGRPCAAVDIGIGFLAPAIDGPLAVAAEVLRSDTTGALVRVDVVDERSSTDRASDPRPVVVAHVTVA